MQDTPCKAGTPLGHMYPVPMELAGVIYTRIHPKVSIKLLWGRKQVKGAHFRDQDDRAEKTDAAQGLEEADAVINQLPPAVYLQLYAVLRVCCPDVPGIPDMFLYTA